MGTGPGQVGGNGAERRGLSQRGLAWDEPRPSGTQRHRLPEDSPSLSEHPDDTD